MAFLREQILVGLACDCGCGRRGEQRAHLDPKGSGGNDRGNTVVLNHICHRAQEKRTARFSAERGVDLYAKARAWAERYARRLAA